MRWLALIWWLLPAAAWGLDSVAYNGLCVGPVRLVRSPADPTVLEVYCVNRPGEPPALRIVDCKPGAQVETEGKQKTIRCPAALPVIVTYK